MPSMFACRDDLALIGRTQPIFDHDVREHDAELRSRVGPSRFLIIGGAGSVGQSITKELLSRNPRALHVVDINENALAELVRDVRLSIAHPPDDLRFSCVDCGHPEFEALVTDQEPYDYVLYLAALKHVRSEKDPYTLMRMVRVNVLNVVRVFDMVAGRAPAKFFTISTDKAARPINAMGASKALAETFITSSATRASVSSVRLANVAFSNGSLPQAFTERVRKRQPIAAPADVRRYFITESEAAQLCMMSLLLGASGERFFPKRQAGLTLQTLADVAHRYLASLGLQPAPFDSDAEARGALETAVSRGQWPCLYPTTDTTGEKVEEEFVEADADVGYGRFEAIGVIRPEVGSTDTSRVTDFLARVDELLQEGHWTRTDILDALHRAVPDFAHVDTGRFLDEKV